MTPDQLIRAMAVIVEECAQGRRDRVTGDMQPLRREEWLAIKDRIDTMIVMNCPRKLGEENAWI